MRRLGRGESGQNFVEYGLVVATVVFVVALGANALSGAEYAYFQGLTGVLAPTPDASTPVPTFTPMPTSTPTPIPTSTSTPTPVPPTSTPTPIPTATPTVTPTPTPCVQSQPIAALAPGGSTSFPLTTSGTADFSVAWAPTFGSGGGPSTIKIELFDSSGNLLTSVTRNNSATLAQTALPAGTYTVKLTNSSSKTVNASSPTITDRC
jgi:Flp pilus assembly pilin Flp